MMRSLIQKIARSKNLVVSFLLATTILSVDAGSLLAGMQSPENNKAADTQANMSLIFNRAALASGAADTLRPIFPEEEFLESYTFVAEAEADVDSSVKPLWNSLKMLEAEETIVGRALISFAKIRGLTYRYEQLGEKTYGKWITNQNAVYIDNELPLNFHPVVLMHETLHDMQEYNGVNTVDIDKSIRETQTAQLCCEAAGMAVCYLIAFEFLQNGNPAPWQELRLTDSTHADQVLAIWNGLKSSGTPYVQALAETGKIAFGRQFEQQGWLDAYNYGILLDYLYKTVNKEMRPLSEKTFTLDEARKTGYISPEFNFTANISSLPAKEDLFGDNDRMRWAFDCAELYRVKKTHGKNSALYQSMREYMEENENPYLDLNMKKVFQTYGQWSSSMTILDMMDAMKEGTVQESASPKTNREYSPSRFSN